MREIQIGGLVSFTTIDYPGRLAAVLFLVGCPLRCAYCSNPHLLSPGDGEYAPDKVSEWLRTRVGKLEAVVFSGGEALMQGDTTIEYMRTVRDMGFKIGLHTNGFYPDVLRRAIDVIDWVGLDFKATCGMYPALTGQGVAYENMLRSLDILIEAKKDFEVRITCDPRYIDKDNLMEIMGILGARGVQNVAIQKYIPHFEDENNQTTTTQREQFFTDVALREKINEMFPSVIWRAG
ncbi:MAG: anaerobic ribonucleoside-triphosphate reductase activating protein [Alphaproteobacteria bacterium]|nr:anaerobic ribonucleoside-triphosphate reductase activating protein [Alphaproteobacteria bacterium]